MFFSKSFSHIYLLPKLLVDMLLLGNPAKVNKFYFSGRNSGQKGQISSEFLEQVDLVSIINVFISFHLGLLSE